VATYRLQTLLEIRERAKEEAQRFLAEAMAALKAEQDRLRDLENELERMIARRETKKREYAEKAMRGEMDARSAVAANVYIERLKEQEQLQADSIEAQKGVVAQKTDEVDAARQDLIRADQELKALEKHKEKWAEEVKKERQAKEEIAADEIAQTIHRRRREDM